MKKSIFASDEAQKTMKALEPKIRKVVEDLTVSCVRCKKMTVTTEYSPVSKLVGVTEAFGTEILLPTISTLSEAQLTVGTAVWVFMPFSSLSNAIVLMTGSGNIGTI